MKKLAVISLFLFFVLAVGSTSAYPIYGTEILLTGYGLMPDDVVTDPNVVTDVALSQGSPGGGTGASAIGAYNLGITSKDSGNVLDFSTLSYSQTIPHAPEPATMLLLGSGLIGLGAYGRKRFLKK